MRTFARRSSVIALAGVLALGAVACGDDADDAGTDVNVTEQETTPAVQDTVTEQDTMTEMDTEMATETETMTEDMTSPSETTTE